MALEDAQRADEVADLAAPASADLEVLAVDLPVDVDRARAGVGVVAGNHVAAAVAPNFTADAPVKFVPVTVTEVPPALGPDDGLTAVTVGAGGGAT